MDVLRKYEELNTRDKIKFFLGLEKFFRASNAVLDIESICDEQNDLTTFIKVVKGENFVSLPNVPKRSQRTLDPWVYKTAHPSSNIPQSLDVQNVGDLGKVPILEIAGTDTNVQNDCRNVPVEICSNVQQNTLPEYEFSVQEKGYVVSEHLAPEKVLVDNSSESEECETSKIDEPIVARRRKQKPRTLRPSKVRYNLRTKTKLVESNNKSDVTDAISTNDKDSVPLEQQKNVLPDNRTTKKNDTKLECGPTNGDIELNEHILQNTVNSVIGKEFDVSAKKNKITSAEIAHNVTKKLCILLDKTEISMEHFMYNAKKPIVVPKRSKKRVSFDVVDNSNSKNTRNEISEPTKTEESSVHDKKESISQNMQNQRQKSSPKCDNTQLHSILNQKSKTTQSSCKEKCLVEDERKTQNKCLVDSTELSSTLSTKSKNKRKIVCDRGSKIKEKKVGASNENGTQRNCVQNSNSDICSLVNNECCVLITTKTNENLLNSEQPGIPQVSDSESCSSVNNKCGKHPNSVTTEITKNLPNLEQPNVASDKTYKREECSIQNSFESKTANDLAKQRDAFCEVEQACSAIGLSASEIFKRKEINDLLTKQEGLSPDALIFLGSYKCPRTEKKFPVIHVHKSKKELWDASCKANNL